MEQADIVIVGAGMVGLVQALALQASGLKVALIDAQHPQPYPSGEAQLRISALSIASQQVLSAVGAWQHIDPARLTPYQAMHVWDQDSFAYIDFCAEQVEQNQLGFIVENQTVIASLWEQVTQVDFIQVFTGVTIKQIHSAAQGCYITLSDEKVISARLLIGADGAQSKVRHSAQLPLTYWDYDQTAIVATVTTSEPHNNVARQVFTPSGPLALLPLWDKNQCSIVWSQDNQQADALLALSPEEFNKAISVAFDQKLGLCHVVGERHSYPLKMRYARQWLKEGVIIVGDAAHTIHPLAGQGANLGILDAAALAERICWLVRENKDFALLRHLRPVERWRKSEALKLIAAMEGFKRVFGHQNLASKLLRDVGLSAVNAWPTGKHALIKQAMGLSGELPKMARVNQSQP
jgi:2-polyprenylphenol 6-hydroxylase